jgi:hypothetical protein
MVSFSKPSNTYLGFEGHSPSSKPYGIISTVFELFIEKASYPRLGKLFTFIDKLPIKRSMGSMQTIFGELHLSNWNRCLVLRIVDSIRALTSYNIPRKDLKYHVPISWEVYARQ